jgi:hypothetical protein
MFRARVIAANEGNVVDALEHVQEIEAAIN